MVNHEDKRRNRIFRALADPTRRKILRLIAQKDVSVADIRQPFNVSPPAISKQLKILENADLIVRLKDGKKRRFRLRTDPLDEAKKTITELSNYWNKRLDGLDEFLKSQKNRN